MLSLKNMEKREGEGGISLHVTTSIQKASQEEGSGILYAISYLTGFS